MNNRFLKALKCCNTSRPPIWLMRQAGRYIPEYRAFRSKYSFFEMCHHPELVVEITQMPIRLFDFDAAILFSDILLIVDALERGLRFEDGTGPIIEHPIRSEEDIDNLPSPCIQEKLGFVAQSIKMLKPLLTVPLIGFCGAPFTIASYLIEGQSSRDLKKTKQWMFHRSASFQRLLDIITKHTITYLNMQIEAGVQVLQIFDSWAHVLSHSHFLEYSLKYFDRLMKGLKTRNIPVILFCRGSSIFAEKMATLHPSAISLDWQCDMRAIRKIVPEQIALQGNLDPDVLCAPLDVLQKEASKILKSMQNDRGYIFNLGHGILPETPVDSVKALVELVKTWE